jgi:hypothetical protein
MFLHPQGGYAQRPQYHDAPYGREPEPFRREQERMLAQLLRQRQSGLVGGHAPGLGGMGGHQSPFLSRHGMSPMMGGYPHHGLPPQMVMGPGMGMPMGLMGMSPHMGRSPHLSIGLGMDMGLGQPPFGHSSYGRRRQSPFGYDSPGPPRAHSFLPHQQRHAYSPFGGARHSPFSPPSMMFGDDDYYEDMYRTPPRHHLGRSMRSQPFGLPPQRRSRRRDYQRSMFGESEDEYEDYEDYDDDYDDEDMFGSHFSGQSPYLRTLRY